MKTIIHIILFCLYTPALLGQGKEYHRVVFADSVIFEDTTLADSAIYGPHWMDIYKDLKYYADNIRSAKTDYIEGTTPWGSPYLYTLYNNKQDSFPLRPYLNREPKYKFNFEGFGIANIFDSVTKEETDSMFLIVSFHLYYSYSGILYKAKLKAIFGTPEIIEKRDYIDYESLLNRIEVIRPAHHGEYPVHWSVNAPLRFGIRQDYPTKTIKE